MWVNLRVLRPARERSLLLLHAGFGAKNSPEALLFFSTLPPPVPWCPSSASLKAGSSRDNYLVGGGILNRKLTSCVLGRPHRFRLVRVCDGSGGRRFRGCSEHFIVESLVVPWAFLGPFDRGSRRCAVKYLRRGHSLSSIASAGIPDQRIYRHEQSLANRHTDNCRSWIA